MDHDNTYINDLPIRSAGASATPHLGRRKWKPNSAQQQRQTVVRLSSTSCDPAAIRSP